MIPWGAYVFYNRFGFAKSKFFHLANTFAANGFPVKIDQFKATVAKNTGSIELTKDNAFVVHIHFHFIALYDL